MFNLRRVGELSFFESDLFPIGVAHGFFTKKPAQGRPGDGQECPNFRIDSLPGTARWWNRLRDSLYSENHVCFANRQVHSGIVRIVDPDNLEGTETEHEGFRIRILGEGDAILKPFTRMRIFLAITTADCMPCLVLDRASRTVGVVHIGWRGLAADLPAAAMSTLRKSLGSRLEDILWAVGPSIDRENYQVGPEVIAALETAGYAESDWRSTGSRPGWVREKRSDRYKLDLAACLRLRLKGLGMRDEQIDICNLSTYGNPNLFYSFRRDGGIKGLQASVIA